MSIALRVRELSKKGIDLAPFVEYVRPILVSRTSRRDYQEESYDPVELAKGLCPWLRIEELVEVEGILLDCEMGLL